MIRLALLILAASILMASRASSQSAYTTVTVLDVAESNYVICASGADVTYHFPLRADGSPDTRKLVVECPATVQGPIWIEERPILPSDALGQTIYFPFMKESN